MCVFLIGCVPAEAGHLWTNWQSITVSSPEFLAVKHYFKHSCQLILNNATENCEDILKNYYFEVKVLLNWIVTT